MDQFEFSRCFADGFAENSMEKYVKEEYIEKFYRLTVRMLEVNAYMNLTAITELGRYFEDVIGYERPPRTPFVGRNFNVTRAGIHADGLLKDEEIYNIFDTQKILGRPALVAVDSHSGLAGIAHWMNGFYRLNGTPAAIDKKHPVIALIKAEVDKQYEDGRTTVMGDDELESIFKAVDPVTYKMVNHYHG